ncbi:arsinothricin resistance N-acetyltransferase ArsN1 family B [Bradyrhizobium sp.]|jgi:L-amino acid N-acyltransferase YncA|uniref:arsinothricin resistance N-acetyltransferase ArsN1 family B n=1 Tax=Bradyrhizobium sp. TaxID=376 RepID=UPI002B6708F0|nr:arsinothricin resistance N-acetyltransferase ArsN1 family B [Bradyrhizobium sp.]HWX59133.1 arsinothricin resistance N-acetyltransferase ArsN1 family B [Bradyrhizobium sp.]
MARRIRVAMPADADQILAIYAPIVRDTTISFEDEPPTAEEMAGRIAGTLATHPYLVCEEDGRVRGYIYASVFRARAAYRWSVETTVYIDGRTRRSGVGRALYEALLPILRRQGFHSAFAGIALPNAGSVGLHETLEFRSVGVCQDVGFKHGQWRDVGWWRLGLSEGPPAADPIPFAALAAEIEAIIQPSSAIRNLVT